MQKFAFLLVFFWMAAGLGAQDLAYENDAVAPAVFANRWVSAPDGLRLRDKPSQDGKVLTVIPFGTKLVVKDRSQTRILIDGALGSWIQVDAPTAKGWCFSGFVATFDPKPVEISEENLYGNWGQLGGAALVLDDDSSFTAPTVEGQWEFDPSGDLRLTSSDGTMTMKAKVASLTSNRLVIDLLGLHTTLYRKEEYVPSLDNIKAE